jgi:hypothetical protein
MENNNLKNESNDGNVLLMDVAGTVDGLCMGFNCKICDGTQTLLQHSNKDGFFPVCDECLKDLKEFVLLKRK